MSKPSVIRFVALFGVALGVGTTVSTSCIGVNYPTVAFRCNPRQADNCPETHYCCSDDPAAEDGALPNYQQKNISAGKAPYFSGMNNALGTKGMCVNRDDIPTGQGLLEASALNCPIPCNPTWERGEIDIVCGATRVCCQTTEIEQADCVLVDDEWRAVTGDDIGVRRSDDSVITDWGSARHATHQDAVGAGCLGLAGGMMNDVFEDCIRQLTVADQRGFCMALAPGQACPTAQPTYIDACEALNGGGAMVPPA